jgi:hypothetical protein
LYVYAISFNPDMSHGSWAEFETNLPDGAYVIGYGCTKISGAECKTNGSTESTPFTFAGHVVDVPEPSSLLLTAFGVGLVGVRRRRRA